jgi:hypothetical protein
VCKILHITTGNHFTFSGSFDLFRVEFCDLFHCRHKTDIFPPSKFQFSILRFIASECYEVGWLSVLKYIQNSITIDEFEEL